MLPLFSSTQHCTRLWPSARHQARDEDEQGEKSHFRVPSVNSLFTPKDKRFPLRAACTQPEHSIQTRQLSYAEQNQHALLKIKYSSNQITKKEPKSDDRLSKFDWYNLSPIFLARMLYHCLKVFQKSIKHHLLAIHRYNRADQILTYDHQLLIWF